MRKITMLLLALFIVGVFVAPQVASTGMSATFSQQTSGETRISGTIARSNADKSTLTIKEHRSQIEKTVIYNNSTKWLKGGNAVDMKQFKDGARVICLGKLNEKGELTATRIDLE